MWHNAVLLTLLVASAGGAPQSQEDPAYPEELAIYPVDAQMVSSPESLVVREGVNISLPCHWEGEDAGEIIVLWKKRPNTILFTGPLKITGDERIRLGPNNELMVSDIKADDDGTYVCTVAVTPDPLELQHTVTVEWPARLHPLDKDHYEINEGEMFELNCRADGYPEPVVTWSKLPAADAEGPYVDNGELVATTVDNGELVATTSMPEGDDMAFLPESPSKVALTLDPVEPRHTGTYTCTAQNGIGEPDVLTAKVEVLHAPHIARDEAVVRTAHGMTAEVGCKVFANPRAEVIWQRNGRDLPVNSRYETTVSSRYYSLKIRDVKDEDLGNYTCRAKNDLGQNENHIALTGMPGPVELHLGQPQKVEGGQQSTTVTWEFISYSTVEETSVTLKQLKPAGSSEVWRVPTVTSRTVAKTGEYQLSPLQENTTYMVQVAARNQYGWTPTADVFFSIIGGQLTVTQEPPKLAESTKKNGGEATGRLKLTPILLIAILSSFF